MRAWLLLASLFIFTQVQAATEPEKFGDWSKRCENDAAGEVCFIEQIATDKKTGRPLMQLRLGYLPGNEEPIMIATVPLGALLQPGVAYFMNNEQLVQMPYLACSQEGCTSTGQKVPSRVLDMMRKGKEGEVRVMLLNRQVISLPVSLKGFTAGFKSLKP